MGIAESLKSTQSEDLSVNEFFRSKPDKDSLDGPDIQEDRLVSGTIFSSTSNLVNTVLGYSPKF
jgi:hypothetical protein